MEMLLMGAAMSLLGVAVSSILFAAATRSEGEAVNQPEARPAERPVMAAARFFLDERAVQAHAGVPIEALLLQIERHVALEQAAAESFLLAPTSQALHSHTLSPLVH